MRTATVRKWLGIFLAALGFLWPTGGHARMELVSVGQTGEPADGWSGSPSISGDGRFVCFYSKASNLAAGSPSATGDFFLRDRATDTTERVTSGAQEVGGCLVSADGRFVAFGAKYDGSINEDVYLRDRQTGSTRRVSVPVPGLPADTQAGVGAISPDGRYVAFFGQTDNLVAGGTNGWADAFVWDRETEVTERVSVGSDGRQGNGGAACWMAVSADGRYVAFSSDASNLVPYDTNGETDVFLRDRLAGTTERVSVTS